ncbi:MAG: winged helix-turn-helix transcriptional regulator [Candidatus Micrarchaeota archaeon]
MEIRKKIILGLVTVAIFIFLTTVLAFVFALYSQGQEVPEILNPFIHFHIEFMILMGVFGLLSGLIVYSIMSQTLEKQKQIVKTNTGIIMKFLSGDEREILQLLLTKDGMTTQSEIAKLPGMSRLKAHRIVKKLETRGIIYIEKYGKINMIRIVNELKEI